MRSGISKRYSSMIQRPLLLGWTARRTSSSDTGTGWILQKQRKRNINSNQGKYLGRSMLKFCREPVSLFWSYLPQLVEFWESGRCPRLLAGWRSTFPRWEGWLSVWKSRNCRRVAVDWFREGWKKKGKEKRDSCSPSRRCDALGAKERPHTHSLMEVDAQWQRKRKLWRLFIKQNQLLYKGRQRAPFIAKT